MSERKRGALSTKEKEFIHSNKDVMTIEELADACNRNVEPIAKYLRENKLGSGKVLPEQIDDITDKELAARLHNKHYWLEVKRQFGKGDNEELRYFERTWIALVKQFKDDIFIAEEMSIKQWITLEILMNRSMNERNKHVLEIDRLQKLIDDECQHDKEARDNDKLDMWRQQLMYVRGAVNSYTTEHTKLLAEIQKIEKSLKMSREQRIKKIEDGKKSWVDLIKELEEHDERERAGREAAILAKSAEKAKIEFSQPIVYGDDIIDLPILNTQTYKVATELKAEQDKIDNEQRLKDAGYANQQTD